MVATLIMTRAILFTSCLLLWATWWGALHAGYDTHAPTQLIIPTTVYFFAATLRAMCREDQVLETSLPAYRDYQEQTTMLVPWLL